mgnify:FL=1
MKTSKIEAICVAICMILALPAFASSTRASEQLHSYGIDVNRPSGEVTVTISVSGKVDVTKTGCEIIRIYEKVGSFWVVRDYLREDDPNMYVNSRIYLHTHTFDANDNAEYRVDVTIFAENAAGRDTRSFTYYV